MSRFVTADRDTVYLFPPSVSDWLPEDHLARFVVEVVDQLDLSELTQQYAGREPKPPQPGPKDKDQVNLTDEQSRIMPVSGGGFEQCYNAQASVDTDTMLVMSTHVTQATNDKQQIEPALQKLDVLPHALGTVTDLLADTGYFSANNVGRCAKGDVQPLLAVARDHHHLTA